MERSKKRRIFFVTCGLLLPLLCLLSLRLGAKEMSFSEFFGALLGAEGTEGERLILYHVRAPRVLGGIVAGVGLSVSGALLQSVTGNDMASPSLIGVNAGAGFAAILSLSFFSFHPLSLSLCAFLGAFLTTLFIVSLSLRLRMKQSAVILVGVAVSSLFSAGISFLSLLDDGVLSTYNAFSVGSLSGLSFSRLALPFAAVAFSFLLAFLLSGWIDLLSLGDGMAGYLGARIGALRTLAMLLASLSAAAVVSFAGLLGFVGLMAPHIARRFTGGLLRRLLPGTALVGASLVVAADLVGRLLLAPGELAVGIPMAFLGAPFFLALLLLGRGGRICDGEV